MSDRWAETAGDPLGHVYRCEIGDGIAWMVRRGRVAMCGYIGFPPGSPLYGEDENWADGITDVHGGFTFAGTFEDPDGEIEPLPVEVRDWWWLGWDYAHAWDAVHLDARTRELLGPDNVLQRGHGWIPEEVEPQAEEAARGFSQELVRRLSGQHERSHST